MRIAHAPRPVLVDTDPGLLARGLDVDDELALLFLLSSPDVDVVAVTTSYGNTSSPLAYRGAKKLLALAGRSDIPVFRGAGWLSRDMRETESSRAIVEVARAHRGALTLLALAPLTNVAAALAADPELPLAELVLMGGRTSHGARQFNFRMHPDATRAALAAPCPKVAITHELCSGVAIRPEDVARLAVPGSVVAPFVRRIRRFARLQSLYRSTRRRVEGAATGGFHPWDVIAAAWLVAPEIFGDVHEVRTTVDARGRTRFVDASHAPTRMPHTLDVERFRALFFERIPATKSGR